MKYTTKAQVIAAAQAAGSTATTWNGSRRWLLAHVTPIRLDYPGARSRHTIPGAMSWRIGVDGHRYQMPLRGRAAYARTAWIARIEARADRAAAALGIWSMADAEALAATLTQPYLDRASASLMSSWPYRRSESKWAGGEHTVRVSIAAANPLASIQYMTSAVGGSERVWSSNGKWSGTNSYANIYTDIPTLLAVPSLHTKDGLALCHAEQIGTREYRVRWIEQSTGVLLKTVDGYLVRGYHVRAASIEQARKKAAKARALAVAATIRERQNRRTKREGLAALRNVYLDVADSIRAGNCAPSTDSFAAKMWRELGASGPCAVRADVVLARRDDIYTRRALGAAYARA